MAGFKKMATAGKITANTFVFNNMISNKSELEQKWLVPVMKGVRKIQNAGSGWTTLHRWQ